MTHVFASYHPSVPFAFIVIAALFSPWPPCIRCTWLFRSRARSRVVRAARRSSNRAFSNVGGTDVCDRGVANPLFSASGSTELFHVGGLAYTGNRSPTACARGHVRGGASVVRLVCALHDGRNSLALLGNVAPTVTLMASQVLRFVPQFVSRGATVAAVHDAASAARPCHEIAIAAVPSAHRIGADGVGDGRRHRPDGRHAGPRLRLRDAVARRTSASLRPTDAVAMALIVSLAWRMRPSWRRRARNMRSIPR